MRKRQHINNVYYIIQYYDMLYVHISDMFVAINVSCSGFSLKLEHFF